MQTSNMEVGYQRRPATKREELTEWTLEHHKHLVDAALQLGLDDLKVETPKARILIVELMNSAEMKGVSRATILLHMINFQRLLKSTLDSLSSGHSLTGAFESLNIGEDLSLWRLEHHKRLVEAVIRLGGLGKANPIGILMLMEEERRRGLIQQTILKHLLRLRHLQKKTQESIIQLYNSRTSTMRRIKKERIEAFYRGKYNHVSIFLIT